MTLREIVLLGLLLAALGTAALLNPAFLAPAPLRDLLAYCAPALIVGAALTLVISAREIDVSVGAQLGLLAALLGVLSSPSRTGLPVPLVCATVLLAGVLLGLANAWLVALTRAPSLIVTLGVRSILLGATQVLLGGEWITDLPPDLRAIGLTRLGGFPIAVLLTFAWLAVVWSLAHATPLGLSIFALGGSEHAATLAGVPVRRLGFVAFGLLGLSVGVATLVSVPELAVVDSGIGVGFELTVITAVVLGGTSVDGGRGSVLGTVLAVLLLGVLRSALVYARLGESAVYWERTIEGGLIVAALLSDRLLRRPLRSAP